MRSDDRVKPFDPNPAPGGSVGAEVRDGEERRADPRHPVYEPAPVKVLNPLQTATRFSARIVEISRRGMKLRMNQYVTPGTLAQIRFMGKLALAEVRYCQLAGEEQYVGVRFQDVLDTDPADSD